jgi:ribosomal protein S4
VNAEGFEVKLSEAPKAIDIPVEIDTSLVVEFYSR